MSTVNFVSNGKGVV